PRKRPRTNHALAQRLALEVLERHDELAVDLGAVQTADHVRIVEAGEDRHLVDELPTPGLAARQLAAQHLERDATSRQALLGLVDLAHPALADQPSDQEVPDPTRAFALDRRRTGGCFRARRISAIR